jgi:hypothetical protein
VVCGNQVEDLYGTILYIYDTITQGIESGAYCLCTDADCSVPGGNACIGIVIDAASGQPNSCFFFDVATDNSNCLDCTICGDSGVLVEVETATCLGDPAECFATPMVTDLSEAVPANPPSAASTLVPAPSPNGGNGSSLFQGFCSDMTGKYHLDFLWPSLHLPSDYQPAFTILNKFTADYEETGYNCLCSEEESLVACAQQTTDGYLIAALSQDPGTGEYMAGVNCLCSDQECSVSPAICFAIYDPTGAAPFCTFSVDFGEECMDCTICSAIDNFEVNVDMCLPVDTEDIGCASSGIVVPDGGGGNGVDNPISTPPVTPPATAPIQDQTQFPVLDQTTPPVTAPPGSTMAGSGSGPFIMPPPTTAPPALSSDAMDAVMWSVWLLIVGIVLASM